MLKENKGSAKVLTLWASWCLRIKETDCGGKNFESSEIRTGNGIQGEVGSHGCLLVLTNPTQITHTHKHKLVKIPASMTVTKSDSKQIPRQKN